MLRLLVVLLLAVAFGRAQAAESTAVTTARSTVTLISDTDAIGAGKPFRVALRFRLADGWHIYWSNPGDAGQAPELKLALPDDSTAGGIVWPTPIRISEGPVMTYSYTGEVVLPVTVTAEQASGAYPIDAKANWLICAKLCVPEQGSFHLDLTSGEPAPSPEAALFRATDVRVPQPSPFQATIAKNGALTLAGEGLDGSRVEDAWFFPATSGIIDQAEPQRLTVRQGSITLALKPVQGFDPSKNLDGTIVLKDRAGTESDLTIQARPGNAPAGLAGATPSSQTSLAGLLLFGLLGGLILNLMPCVFPILAMKAMAIARLSGAERRLVRDHAFAYASGVVVAFLGFAILLLTLRGGGAALGWGFQFQSPVFVAGMAWLLFAIGLNLSGVFEVGLQVDAGQKLAGRGGYTGSFFTGLLAVLVATPCTAPFMGIAIASALTAPAFETIGIFLAMAIGLASPYVLLGLFPGLASLLPRPGRWMEILRQLLSFPMYAAVVWLVWVLSQQVGADGVLIGAMGLLAIGFAAWAVGLSQKLDGTGRRLALAPAILAMVGSVLLLRMLGQSPAPSVAASDAEPFSAARLATLRADHQPVFVNMTAAWCVTCLVNERVALSPESVRRAFAEHHVAYLKGDWTRQDPAITEFLRAHERDGVPLYVFYPADGGEPTVLPQILTENEILQQIDKAGS